MSYSILDVKSAAGNGGTATQALPAFATTGETGLLYVVAMSSFDGIAATTHSAPTDTFGNTYTQIGTTRNVNAAGTTKLSLWIAANAGNDPPTNTITLHATSTMSQITGVAWRLRGPLASPSNGDTAGVAATTSTNPTSGTSTSTPPAGSFFLGCMANIGTPAVTDGAGWNNLTPDYGITPAMIAAARLTENVASQDLYTEYSIAGVAQAATWTEASDTYAAIVASFGPLSASTDGAGSPIDDRYRPRSSVFTSFSGSQHTLVAGAWADHAGIFDPTRDARADSRSRLV